MTDTPNMPDFDDLADIFWRLGVMQSPSELQGYLAGQLAVGLAVSEAQWPELANTFIDPVEPPAGEDHQLLMDLYHATRAAMDDDQMSFDLLLPDDSLDLSQRADNLGGWCKGFMTGFAMGGKQLQSSDGQRQYSSDVSEALSDMAAIAQIVVEDGDEGEERSEQDMVEIVEYLRVAVINIYLECNAPSSSEPADDNPPAIH